MRDKQRDRERKKFLTESSSREREREGVISEKKEAFTCTLTHSLTHILQINR